MKSLLKSLLLLLLIVVPVVVSAEAGPVVDRIIASVDGEPLTFGDLERFVKASGGQVPADFRSNEQAISQVLKDMIVSTMLEKESKELGIAAGDEEVNAYVDEIKRQNNVSDSEFNQLLLARGLDRKLYEDQVRRDIVRSRVLSRQVKSKISISNEDIERYLSDNSIRKPEVGAVHLFRISAEDNEVLRNIYEQAKLVVGRKEEKVDLSGLPKNSISDLGFVSPEDLNPALQHEITSGAVPKVTTLFEEDAGRAFYIVTSVVGDDGVAKELNDSIRSELQEKKAQSRFETYLNEELPKKYVIETYL